MIKELKMVKKEISIQLIAVFTITLLFTFNSGTAQDNNNGYYSDPYTNAVKMVVDALNDSSISIVLCSIPMPRQFNYEIVSESRDTVNEIYKSSMYVNTGLEMLKLLDKIRGDSNIDSLFFLRWTSQRVQEDYQGFLPRFSAQPSSEWILFLDSPFYRSHKIHDILLERYEKVNDQIILNSNNFFIPYKIDAGALPIYSPEKNLYSPGFIYSKELVDDLKTIIKLQENPLLLSGLDDSYERYYSSMNDDLGKRVFSRLFGSSQHE